MCKYCPISICSDCPERFVELTGLSRHLLLSTDYSSTHYSTTNRHSESLSPTQAGDGIETQETVVKIKRRRGRPKNPQRSDVLAPSDSSRNEEKDSQSASVSVSTQLIICQNCLQLLHAAVTRGLIPSDNAVEPCRVVLFPGTYNN